MNRFKFLCITLAMILVAFGYAAKDDNSEVELTREAVSDYIRETTLKYDDITVFDSSNYTEEDAIITIMYSEIPYFRRMFFALPPVK